MNETLVIIEAVAAAVLGLTTFVTAALGRRPGWVEVIGAGVLALGMLVQAIVAFVLMATSHDTTDGPTFVLYALASVLLLPVGVLWAAAEKTRWGNVVLGVAFLTLAVVVLRLDVVWGG